MRKRSIFAAAYRFGTAMLNARDTMSKHDNNEEKDLNIGEVYTKTEVFLDKNKQAVTIGVVALLAIVVGLIAYKQLYLKPRAAESAEYIWKAQYYFEVDSLDLAINGDGNYFGFQYIADEFGGTPSGKLAHYYLGAIYMQKGEYDAAIAEYKQADLEDDVLRVMAVGGIGDAYVELGNTKEAISQFEKAASMTTNDLTTPMYLMKAGILYKQNGDWKAAKKAFDRIAKEFPTAAEATMARKYLGLAGSLAG